MSESSAAGPALGESGASGGRGVAGPLQRVRELKTQLEGEGASREEAIDELRSMLTAPERPVQLQAAAALAGCGVDEVGKEAMEAAQTVLLEGLNLSSSGSAVALNKMGGPVIPAVILALKNEDPTVRKNAAFCLGLTWSVELAEERVEALSDVALSDAEPKVRAQAAVAIAILSRQDDVDPQLKVMAAPVLSEVLSDDSAAVRQPAVRAIGDMGHRAHPVIPAMLTLLAEQSEDIETRSSAADALGMLASPLPVYRGQVQPGEEWVDYRADDETTGAALAALMGLLGDDAPALRASAARGIGHIGSPAVPAVPLLEDMLEDEELQVRVRAAEALVLVAEEAARARAILTELKDGKDRQWKTIARRALERGAARNGGE